MFSAEAESLQSKIITMTPSHTALPTKSPLDSPQALKKAVQDLLQLVNSLEKDLNQLFGVGDSEESQQPTATTPHLPRNYDRLINLLHLEKSQLLSLLDNPSGIKKQHIKSTNAFVYQGIYDVLRREVALYGTESVEATMETVKIIGPAHGNPASGKKRFYHSKQHRSAVESLTIDLVLRFGALWLKVKSRNKRAIQENFLGMTDGTEKCITAVAEEMKKAASVWPIHYHERHCAIYFTKGVTQDVAEAIMEEGVSVLVKGGVVTPVEEDMLTEDSDEDDVVPQQSIPSNPPGKPDSTTTASKTETSSDEKAQAYSSDTITPLDADLIANQSMLPSRPVESSVVNLDITTLIVLVAQAARGTEDFTKLIQYINSKERVVCTHSALRHFSKLVQLGGSELEKHRAYDMVLKNFDDDFPIDADEIDSDPQPITKSIEIIPDDPHETVTKCLKGSKIKTYHKCVFGTAHKLEFVTSTSNAWLVSCAESRGIHLSVHLHQSYTLDLFDRRDKCNGRRKS